MILRVTGIFVAAVITVAAQSRPDTPASGRELLEHMHAAYAGKWFRTLTFVQKTTVVRPDGTVNEQRWFESLKAPDLLRIDVAPLSNGNGTLNKPAEVIVMRAGQVANTRPEGNPFLPFVAGIYTQPVDRTIAQMTAQRYAMTAIRADEFQGRKVFVVGADRRDDVTSPQFWVDAERLVVVRVILASGTNALDCALDNYIKSGASWVATKVSMTIGGKLRQLEEYTDVKTNVDLPDDLFDPARWTLAKHWAAAIK